MRALIGHRRRGRDERLEGIEGGIAGDCRISVRAAAALPADPQHHRRREKLNNHFPSASGDDAGLFQTLSIHPIRPQTCTQQAFISKTWESDLTYIHILLMECLMLQFCSNHCPRRFYCSCVEF